MSLENLDGYERIHGEEGWGTLVSHGIQIFIRVSPMPNLDDPAIRIAVGRASDVIKDALLFAAANVHPELVKQVEEERKGLLALFENPIFVEEIPNGYGNDWFYRRLPWFVVTTKIGRIKIGWRKRVISIDWSDSLATVTAEDLFPLVSTTKIGRSIHAWSHSDAKSFIDRVIESVPNT